MAKYFLAASNGQAFHRAILDLDHLPSGASSDLAAHPWKQGLEITGWLEADIERFIRLIDQIASHKYTSETLEFISNLASFWENLPPADVEKHAFLGGAPERVDFVRTSEEVATDMYAKCGAFRKS